MPYPFHVQEGGSGTEDDTGSNPDRDMQDGLLEPPEPSVTQVSICKASCLLTCCALCMLYLFDGNAMQLTESKSAVSLQVGSASRVVVVSDGSSCLLFPTPHRAQEDQGLMRSLPLLASGQLSVA